MTASRVFRIVIADDHRIFLDGLAAILQKEGRIEVAGTAINYRESRTRLLELRPDVLITDLNMPGKNGVEMIREIRSDFPDLKLIVLTMYHDKGLIKELKELGIAGYLLKHTDSSAMLESLNRILSGERHIDQHVTAINNNRDFGSAQVSEEFKDDFKGKNTLGKRERELMALVAKGLSNQEIANSMFVSIDTVYSHRKHIKQKLGITNNAQFVNYAMKIAEDRD